MPPSAEMRLAVIGSLHISERSADHSEKARHALSAQEKPKAGWSIDL
ncbi:hypothetical protein ACFOHY_16360 [Rhizobium rosettiformans]